MEVTVYKTPAVGPSVINKKFFECQRCNHKWYSIKNYFMCPRCKSKDILIDGETV